MKTCLIVTNSVDFHTDAVVEKLRELGGAGSFFRLNTDRFHSDYEIHIDPAAPDFSIRNLVNDKQIAMAEVNSVWWRRPGELDFAHSPRPEDLRTFLDHEYKGALHGLVSCLETVSDLRFISHPLSILRARDKVRQQILARKIAFDLPGQVITNSKENLSSQAWKNAAIAKSLGSGSANIPASAQNIPIATRPLSADALAAIESGTMPLELHYFQQRLRPSHELRVTCFGSHCFPVRITGPYLREGEVDWRMGDQEKLSLEFEEKFEAADECFEFMRQMNLAYGAFDFIREGDRLYFLECNPNGQWLFCDFDGKFGMLDAFARFLLQ